VVRAAALFAGAFFAAALRAGAFLAGALLAGAFFAAAFVPGALLAGAFFAAFLLGDFLATAFRIADCVSDVGGGEPLFACAAVGADTFRAERLRGSLPAGLRRAARDSLVDR
jgi:hypothetical protein